MLERDREVKNAGRMTIEGRAYRELVVVVTMRGRWTIKRKEKEKRKGRRGREGGGEGGGRTAREAIWWSERKFIYTEPYIPTRKGRRYSEYLVVAGSS